MIDSINGKPKCAARTTDSGVPPTPTQVLSSAASRREHGDGGAHADSRRARRDRGQNDLGRRDGEVLAVVLADANEIEPDALGEHGFLDDVANHLRLRQRRALRAACDIAKRVEAELERHQPNPSLSVSKTAVPLTIMPRMPRRHQKYAEPTSTA
jgi:hypothetical protein